MLLSLFAGRQRLLVADLGMAANYSAIHASALAELTLTVATDGTWTYTVGAGDSLVGSPTTGRWLTGTDGAALHELLFTVSNEVGTPTITNGAATYTAITGSLTIKIEKNGADASADLAVSIREIAAPSEAVTESVGIAANGAP